MYFIAILVLMVFIFFTTSLSSTAATLIDIPSLIIVLGFSLPMLIASGLIQDFLRGFKIAAQKENSYSVIELKKTLHALKLMIKLLPLSGALGFVIGAISILWNLPEMIQSDLFYLGANFAVAAISIFYSLLFIFILLPIKTKIEVILTTLD